MLPIPASLSSITDEWLSEVLDQTVTGHRVVDAHAGTTGRGVIALSCEKGATLPERLFVKLPPDDAAQRLFVTTSGMGRREALFYQQLSDEVPLRVPRNYYAVANDSGEEYIMLMEHLEDSGCTFRNASTARASGESMDYIKRVLAAFARLHAAYWNAPRFTQDLAWIDPLMQHEIAAQLVTSSLQQHGASLPAVFRAMAELYLAETDGVHRLWREGDVTLVHGDAHDGNLFMHGREPGFLDWAVLARAPGMRDVGYFLAATLEEGERDALPDLMRYYRQQLQAGGVSVPSEQLLWQQLQWHATYVWLSATVTFAMGDAWQPQRYALSALEKIHGAIEHLQSVSALREAL